MSKQRIEIEVDVPEGWEATGEWRKAVNGDHYIGWPGKEAQWLLGSESPCEVFILRRVEPVRETRWLALHNPMCIGWQQRERARQLAGGNKLIRMDIEDGKLVSVALESVEQPLTPSAPPKE